MPELWTCVLKCSQCLRVIGKKEHTPKSFGIIVDHNDCPDHPRKGFIIEWEKENEQPSKAS